MSEHYDFHYQPTGSGAISGQQVLQQTEDAINELGDYVNDNIGGAMDVAQQALETAQTAETNAQTALDTANSFSGAIQTAQQDASTALSTAQTAQNTASNANNTAIQASQDASNAVTTANNASGQVNTLSGTVTALGQRVTTAEGNIGQNTSDITALTTRVGTAEGNITTLQNDVSIAQGNASSAMATAGTVKQQAYVFRYSSTALTPSSTNSNALLDNTDNLKVGDKVIDSSGVLFSITAIDTANSTFTIGTALVDLALDSDVVHKSGDETITGEKNFQNTSTDYSGIKLEGSRVCHITADYAGDGVFTSSGCGFSLLLPDGNKAIHIGQWISNNNRIYLNKSYSYISLNGTVLRSNTYVPTGETNTATLRLMAQLNYADDTNKNVDIRLIQYDSAYSALYSNTDNVTSLGVATRRWSKIYATEYYYGNDNVEFSTKFVTTDTAQTVSGSKTFSSSPIIYNPDTSVNDYLVLKNSKATIGSTTDTGLQRILFQDKNGTAIGSLISSIDSNGWTYTTLEGSSLDSQSNVITRSVRLRVTNTAGALLPSNDNNISLGSASARWSDIRTVKVNNLEPSSLSLPSGNTSDIIDISSYLSNLDGTDNTYVAPSNGWITIKASTATGISCTIPNLWNDSRIRTSAGVLKMLFPILKGQTVYISIYATTVDVARFIPCQGNV